MMSKTIQISLSTESIEKAIAELKAYKEVIKLKTSIFAQRLADIGIQTIDEHKYSRSGDDFTGTTDFNDLRSYAWVDEIGDKARVTLVLSGKEVAFVEFGAGVHWNGSGGSSPNPFGQGLGMTIGSYGLGHGFEDYWFYYDEERGKTRMTHGTEAAMPMYYADKAIRDKFIMIAKEVFGNG